MPFQYVCFSPNFLKQYMDDETQITTYVEALRFEGSWSTRAVLLI